MEISLYLKDQGIRVPFAAFVASARKLLDLLESVEVVAYQRRPALNWEIYDLKAKSACVELVAVPRDKVTYSGQDVANHLLNGLEMLEKGVRPPGWPDNLLHLASDLASLSKGRRMVVRSPNRTAEVTIRLVANAGKLLESPVQAWGSVEGSLKMISTVKGIQVNVYDVITGRPVTCFIEDEMIPQAANAINRRVSVSGLVTYTPEGYPKSIRQVTDFIVFPPDDELPSVDDLLSSNLDLAGGLTLEEFLEKRRND